VTSFRLSLLAEADLAEILDYVAETGSLQRTEGIHRDLLAAARQLAEMPGIGHAREDLTSQPVLFWAVHSFLIVYRPETKPLEILRVISGWRNVSEVLDGDE
jgi:plasmid stabilization system protein ParE